MTESHEREPEQESIEPELDAELDLENADASPADDDQAPADRELASLREALLRTRAEMDNLQKRSERELDKARKFFNEALLKDLVPVLDSLDQALDNTADDAEAQREGLLLLQKQMLQQLERHGLEAVNPLGQSFNPDWHEAISMQPSAEHAPDTVMMVLQRGYVLNGRLLRPARVVVSREG